MSWRAWRVSSRQSRPAPGASTRTATLFFLRVHGGALIDTALRVGEKGTTGLCSASRARAVGLAAVRGSGPGRRCPIHRGGRRHSWVARGFCLLGCRLACIRLLHAVRRPGADQRRCPPLRIPLCSCSGKTSAAVSKPSLRLGWRAGWAPLRTENAGNGIPSRATESCRETPSAPRVGVPCCLHQLISVRTSRTSEFISVSPGPVPALPRRALTSSQT